MTLLYPPRPGETLGHLNINRPMLVERLNRRNGRVKLPKLGWVRFRMSRPLDEVVIRSVTVAREGRHWFVSFLVEDGVITAAVHAAPHAVVGVNRGVAAAIATSAGELIDREFLSVGERRRAMALQRRLSRSARRGRNREKTRAALGDIRARERQRRQGFCAQAAAQLTSANALVVIEDLKTKNMTRSAKGSLEQPGRNVAAKSGLNRAILAKGWHQFALALSSSARYTGTTVVRVPAAYTSQRCSSCGRVDPKSRESQAVFRCTTCGHGPVHADVNAAKNILAAGLCGHHLWRVIGHEQRIPRCTVSPPVAELTHDDRLTAAAGADHLQHALG